MRIRRRILVVALLAAALVLSSCSTGGDAGTEGSTSGAEGGQMTMEEAYAAFYAAENAKDFAAMREVAAEGDGMAYVDGREAEANARAKNGQTEQVWQSEQAMLDDMLVVRLTADDAGNPLHYGVIAAPGGESAVLVMNLGASTDAQRYTMVQVGEEWKVGTYEGTEPFDRSAYTGYEALFE